MSIEIQSYFAEGERYPALIGVRAQGDEYETAYVSKSELVDALAENAKLRELVCWMYDRMDESCAVQYPYAPAPISYDRLMQALARARELGVEVDDGTE